MLKSISLALQTLYRGGGGGGGGGGSPTHSCLTYRCGLSPLNWWFIKGTVYQRDMLINQHIKYDLGKGSPTSKTLLN